MDKDTRGKDGQGEVCGRIIYVMGVKQEVWFYDHSALQEMIGALIDNKVSFEVDFPKE